MKKYFEDKGLIPEGNLGEARWGFAIKRWNDELPQV